MQLGYRQFRLGQLEVGPRGGLVLFKLTISTISKSPIEVHYILKGATVIEIAVSREPGYIYTDEMYLESRLCLQV